MERGDSELENDGRIVNFGWKDGKLQRNWIHILITK